MRRALLVMLAAATVANAADGLVSIDTRPGVRVGFWLMERPGATATVMLLPGGEGSIGSKAGGEPASKNFLVRSRGLFAEAGFNVAVIGRPSDRGDMDLVFRAGNDHVEDLRVIAQRLKTQLGKPVWLVGTSRGTVSAAAAAALLDPSTVAGIVLTSSVTYVRSAPAVPTMALQDIRVPVLVMHHKRDACRSCDPREAHLITERLTGAPVKKLLLVDGGSGAGGDPCEPLHYHGFIGMEKEAVDAIAAFVRNPAP